MKRRVVILRLFSDDERAFSVVNEPTSGLLEAIELLVMKVV